MKTTGQCPKCKSGNIFTREAKRGEYRGISLGLTAFGLETPETYICKQCGYIEEYFVESQIQNCAKLYRPKLMAV